MNKIAIAALLITVIFIALALGFAYNAYRALYFLIHGGLSEGSRAVIAAASMWTALFASYCVVKDALKK